MSNRPITLDHLLDLNERGVTWNELTDDERSAFLIHLADLMEWGQEVADE